MLDLQPIKDRLAAASPGPWQWFGNESAAGTTYGALSTNGQGLLEIRQADRFSIEADLRLITHAPQDIAALVAEVERLRTAELEWARQVNHLEGRVLALSNTVDSLRRVLALYA